MKPSAYISSFAVLAVYATLPGPFTNALNLAHSPAPKGSVYRVLSVYSDYYEGRTMSNGKKFSQKGFTVASNDWELGTRLILRYNGKSVSVVVTDRMSTRFSGKRVDASKAVWDYLTGNAKPGLRRVTVGEVGR